MASGAFKDFLYSDDIIPVNASGTALTVTKGDYMAFSGIWAVAANTGVVGWKTSGIGIALEQNPWYDELGVARVNTALSVLQRGVVRVTGTSAVGDGSDVLLGLPVRPTTTGSGIVGQTGATGLGPVWTTAGFMSVSGATASAVGQLGGVARLVNVASVGSTGQWDIVLMPQRPDFI